MMKNLKLALVCIAVLTTGQANATWQVISNVMGNEYRYSYDSATNAEVSTFFGKTYRQAWFKQEIINDLNPNDQLTVGDFMLNLWRFDCAQRKLGLSRSIEFKRDGRYVQDIKNPVVAMASIIPDTSGYLMWQKACSGYMAK